MGGSARAWEETLNGIIFSSGISVSQLPLTDDEDKDDWQNFDNRTKQEDFKLERCDQNCVAKACTSFALDLDTTCSGKKYCISCWHSCLFLHQAFCMVSQLASSNAKDSKALSDVLELAEQYDIV